MAFGRLLIFQLVNVSVLSSLLVIDHRLLPVVDCGYITSIASNARVIYPNATQTLLGSVALYTCSPGYFLVVL